MPVHFETLEIGQTYERPYLADLWGYGGFQAISRGVVTPAGTNIIILFVTKVKQDALTQYQDYIEDGYLFWEGEEGHGSDRRIVAASDNGDQVHLFYREIHHSPFVYHGQILLVDHELHVDRPSEFVFELPRQDHHGDVFEDVRLHAPELANLAETEREAIIKSRVGQGRFRSLVIRAWGACSVTGARELAILKASHIKPWGKASNVERLDPANGFLLIPNLDTLFDQGLITFQDDGSVTLSSGLLGEDAAALGVHAGLRLRTVFEGNLPYLRYHREHVFQG